MDSKIKFSFSKKIEKKSLQPSLKFDSTKKDSTSEKKHLLESLDEHSLKRPVEDKEELIIPVIENEKNVQLKNKSNIDKIQKKVNVELDNKPKTLDDIASAALIAESLQKNEDYENNKELPAILLGGYQNLHSADDGGKISTLDDYEQVSIEAYGMALVKGMGWNKESGIGRGKKRVVEMIEPAGRNFCVTPGEIKKVAVNNTNNKENDELELKNGAKVFIHSGRNKGNYATVECIDEDHILLKPARNDSVIREIEVNIKIVSSKEFQDSSRVINKAMYEEFKNKEKENGDTEVKEVIKKENSKFSEHSPKRTKYNNPHNRDTEEVSVIDSKTNLKSDKNYKDNYKEKYRSSKKVDEGDEDKYLTSRKSSSSWAKEGLRVRIINKDYKEGRYHKQKVVVQSIESTNRCICITDNGKTLYNLNPSCFETVIPKGKSDIVYILTGNYRNQKAKILKLNKDREEASLQLLKDSSISIKLHYDDICEYVGR